MNDNLSIFFSLLLYSLPGLIVGFTLHELAHALTAVKLGDPTPRSMGRITLDPRRHVDPVGLGALIVIGFGWAKPVQFSPMYIRTSRQQALVAAAGPFTNLLIAALLALAMSVLVRAVPMAPHDAVASFGHGGAAAVTYYFLYEGFILNIVLFFFNLLPIPGLDGFYVLRALLEKPAPEIVSWMEVNRQIVLVLALLLVFVLPRVQGGGNPLQRAYTSIGNVFYSGDPPEVEGVNSLIGTFTTDNGNSSSGG